jgi:hypothetical protein
MGLGPIGRLPGWAFLVDLKEFKAGFLAGSIREARLAGKTG